jgi:Protein of unknown function (DUF2924)
MPCSSFDREAIEAEINRIRSLGLDELRNLWRATFRAAPPPGFTKDLIARLLSWHIQEQAFGGLDPQTTKHLASFTRGARPPADRPRRLKPGTKESTVSSDTADAPPASPNSERLTRALAARLLRRIPRLAMGNTGNEAGRSKTPTLCDLYPQIERP